MDQDSSFRKSDIGTAFVQLRSVPQYSYRLPILLSFLRNRKPWMLKSVSPIVPVLVRLQFRLQVSHQVLFLLLVLSGPVERNPASNLNQMSIALNWDRGIEVLSLPLFFFDFRWNSLSWSLLNLTSTRFHGPHMFPRSSHAITILHMYPRSHIWTRSQHLTCHSYAYQHAWSHFSQHTREHVVACDVCLLLYKFHSHLLYFLNFQLCVLWLYLIACLQYNLYCR